MSALAIVIPTLNEASTLPLLLGDLALLDVPANVVVADGGSVDNTVDVARKNGAGVVMGDVGRAIQMNNGANHSRGDWLLFIHADTRLTSSARSELDRAITSGDELQAAVWRLRVGSNRAVFRCIEFGARLRDRVLGLPYGDQGLLIRRTLFDSIGGFRELPVLEDVAMVRDIRTFTGIHRFRSPIVVSSRRWDRQGAVRCSLRNLMLVLAYRVGVSPERLIGFYRPEPG